MEARMTAATENIGKSVLVYDVGGSHVSAAVCLQNGYQLGPVVSALHPAQQTSDAFIQLLYALGIEAGADTARVAGAELAMPGPFDFAAGVSQMRHKLPYLFGLDLRQKLSQRFGWEPCRVRFLHDAAAFLLGEIGAGAARGVSRTVGITLGTGVGSAFSVNGSIIIEGSGVPLGGEIWNLAYQGGIVEDFVSSKAIRRTYEQRTGMLREAVEIASKAANDPAALEAFTELGHHLGLALRSPLAVFAPQVVILGGGISRSGNLFLAATRHELEDLSIKVVISSLLDEAPLVGAAVSWFNECNSSSALPQKVPIQLDAS
jgi:glucokinase